MNKLKELKGICVRGSKEHGARIIQAFMDAGVETGYLDCESENATYYYDGILCCARHMTNHTEITIDQLEEIVYKVDWENPPKYVKSKKDSLVIKFKSNTDTVAFKGLCVVENEHFTKGDYLTNWYKDCFRLLTSSELADLEKELETPKVIAGVDFGGSLDALEAITVKPTEQPAKFTVYQRLRVLGFKKLKLDDKIFRDIHGYNPYQMRKQLDSKTFFTWDYSTPEKEDIQLVQEGVIVGRSTVEEVERILEKLK